jgi:hypothetical protein
MDSEKILSYCDQIDLLVEKIRGEVEGDPIDHEPLHEGDDLQAALNEGGSWLIDEGVKFHRAAGYNVPVANTVLRGTENNAISADTGSAFTIPIGQRNIDIENVKISSNATVAVQVGNNTNEQNTVELAPSMIRFFQLTVSKHRGKRAFEIDASDVEFLNCSILDVYDPAGKDSQAIWIGNSPGSVLISDCVLEAASETVMVGGDTMKIPNCRPKGITLRRVHLAKNLDWKTAGTPKVKNIFELKDGHNVLIENSDLQYCWKSAQDGYCFMFTPSQGGSLRNVAVKDCRVNHVGAIVNVTGKDASEINQERTQVFFEGGEYRTNIAEFPGPGRFMLSTNGSESIRVWNALIRHEGSAFIDHADQSHVDVLEVLGTDWNYGSYGIRIGGRNHGDNSLGLIGELVVEHCTITGAHSQFRERFPNNTYISSMSTDFESHVDYMAKTYQRGVEKEVADLVKRLKRNE